MVHDVNQPLYAGPILVSSHRAEPMNLLFHHVTLVDVPNNRCTSQTATVASTHWPPHARSGPNQNSPSNPNFPAAFRGLGPWSLEYTENRALEYASLPFSILTLFQSRAVAVHNSHYPYAIASSLPVSLRLCTSACISRFR
jgi:hypothetical protein